MDRTHQYNNDDDSIDTLYKAMDLAETLPPPPATIGGGSNNNSSNNNSSNNNSSNNNGNAPSPRNQEVSSNGTHNNKNSPQHGTGGNNINNHTVSSSSYVAMDAAQVSNTNYQQQGQQPQPGATANTKNEEEERAFIWELLDFAKKRDWKKKLLTIVIIMSSVSVIVDLIFFGNVVVFVNNFLEWMTQHTVMAVFACILFFAAATLVFVPHGILTFGAGWAFANACGFGIGLIIALFVSFAGSALGAVLSFLRSRYMMRDLVELFASRFPIVKAADRAIERKGFKIMLLLRLCPVIPFNGLNYIGGITSCSLEEYTQALVGILPITLLWTTVGASADKITERETDDFAEKVFLVFLLFFGMLCGIAGLARVYRYAREELRQEIEYDRAESWRKYKKSTGDTTRSLAAKSGAATDEEKSRLDDQGIEVLNRADITLMEVLGIDYFSVEAQRPPGQDDDDQDLFWFWA